MSTTDLERITDEQAAEVLLHGGTVDVISTQDIQDDMVQRILASKSVNDAFANFESIPAKDIEGVQVEVHGVAWMRSKYKEGPGVYALLKCKLANVKDPVVVSMGGRTTMASFLWAQQHEAMPLKGSFVSSQSNTDPEKTYWSFKLA